MKFTLFVLIATAAFAQVRGVETHGDVSVSAVYSCGVSAPVFVLGEEPTCLLVHAKAARPDAARLLITITYERDGVRDFAWKWIDYRYPWETVAFMDFAGCDLLTVEIEVFDANGQSVAWEGFEGE